MFKGNMSTVDRIFRFVLVLAIVGLYLTGNLSGLAAIILGILAAVFLVTSLGGFCPLYAAFKLSTKRQSS